MKSGFRWKIEDPIKNPCRNCRGSGSDWPRRKDGEYDRRYRWPQGPCPVCHGTRRQP